MQSKTPVFGVAVPNQKHFRTNLVQLQIAMSVGALVCYTMGRLVPACSSFATVYYPGAYLYTAGDVFFLVTPVVAWIVFRRDGWRHSMPMALAMIAPVAAMVLVGELEGYAYRPWLITAGYPAMSLGTLAYMLYRAQEPERTSAATRRQSHVDVHTLTGPRNALPGMSFHDFETALPAATPPGRGPASVSSGLGKRLRPAPSAPPLWLP